MRKRKLIDLFLAQINMVIGLDNTNEGIYRIKKYWRDERNGIRKKIGKIRKKTR